MAANGFGAGRPLKKSELSSGPDIFVITLCRNGNSNNTWMRLFSQGSGTNNTPKYWSQDVSLIGMEFQNNRNSVEVDLDIYKNGALEHTWPIRNSRYAYDANTTPFVDFVAGDFMSVFLDDQGTNPNDPFVHFWFRVNSFATGSDSEVN